MQIESLKSFQESYGLACHSYRADYVVLPALIGLYRFLYDNSKDCRESGALDDVTHETVDLARQSHGSFLGRFFDRTEGPLDRRTATFLRSVCRTVALADYPSIIRPDEKSCLHVWHPPSRRWRQHARAISVYLHHPDHGRVLAHLWIGACHDLDDRLRAFQRTDFNWTNLWDPYGRWLAESAN